MLGSVLRSVGGVLSSSRVARFFLLGNQRGDTPRLAVFYHIVSDEAAPHVRHLYPICSLRGFRADMEWLCQYFEPMTLSDWLQRTTYKKPPVLITFDDGLRQCAELVAPVLQEMGLPAAFFINPDFVDNRALMFRYKASLLIEAAPESKARLLRYKYANSALLDQLAAQKGVDFTQFLSDYRPYMTLAQIRQLKAAGHHIGAHSMDHPLYADLDLEAQCAQTQQSIDWVRAHIGEQEPAFAFPFTDFGVDMSFFEALPTGQHSFGCAGLKTDTLPRNHQRVDMEQSAYTAHQKVAAAMLAFQLKKIVGRQLVHHPA